MSLLKFIERIAMNVQHQLKHLLNKVNYFDYNF